MEGIPAPERRAPESCSPGRGSERDAQRGKSKPQRPAFRGQPWLEQGTLHPAFLHILVPLPILKKWESLRDINYPEEVTAIYREVFWGSGGTHVDIGGQLWGADAPPPPSGGSVSLTVPD